MANTIKRNKKIFEAIQIQLKRLELQGTTYSTFFEDFVLESLPAGVVLDLSKHFDKEIEPNILDDDALLLETLKVLGLMEASKDKKELSNLIESKKEIKSKNQKTEKTDFDKVLGAIMKVPKPKE